MKITYRVMLIGVAVLGLGFGLSFGAGVAYGHGNPKTAPGGLTQQQLNQMLGIQTSTGGATTGNGGAQSTLTGRGGAGAAALANNATGKITDISGNTVTIQTRQGTTEKVNISNTTTIQKLATATAADLKVGDEIIAGGSRNSDGSFDAKTVDPVPSELAALLGGGAGGGGNGGPGGATATPTGR